MVTTHNPLQVDNLMGTVLDDFQNEEDIYSSGTESGDEITLRTIPAVLKVKTVKFHEKTSYRSAKRRIQTTAHTLPITEHKNNIVSMIKQHKVVIITGYTGCGKSTRKFALLMY